MPQLFDDSINCMIKALDAAHLRQKVISNNIANINTPGFKPSKVAFEEEMQQALNSSPQAVAGDKDDFKLAATTTGPTQVSHFDLGDGTSSVESVQPKVYMDNKPIDMHQEMSNLTKNQIMYNAIAQKITGLLGAMKYVINAK